MEKLTEEIKRKIGLNLGYILWDDLNEEEKKKAWTDKTNHHYHSFFIKEAKDKFPPMLLFKRVGSGFKCDYIINLNTMKPTKNSPNQKKISDDIIREIVD
jgi:hypothetical protein